MYGDVELKGVASEKIGDDAINEIFEVVSFRNSKVFLAIARTNDKLFIGEFPRKIKQIVASDSWQQPRRAEVEQADASDG